MDNNRTILYIGKSYCQSLDELKDFFRKATSSPSLYEELLTCFRDGMLVDWLRDGDVREQNLADEVDAFSSEMTNSEVMKSLLKIFTNESLDSSGPSFRDFLDTSSFSYKHSGTKDNLKPVLLTGVCNWIETESDDMEIITVELFQKFMVKDIDNEKFYFRLCVDNVDIQRQEVAIGELRKGQTFDIKWIFTVEDKELHVVSVFCGLELLKEFKFQRSSVYTIENGVMTVRPFKDKEICFKMINVVGGSFIMGEEGEKHEVCLDSFYMGEVPVTQELWEVVMGDNPSSYKGVDKPVHDVSWYDCQEFIKELNKQTNLEFRLPTEAEWEYSARGGQKSEGYRYAGSDNINDVGWFSGNCGGPREVRRKLANELGLYDMSGNVYECCQDWYDSEYYRNSPEDNPKGPETGSYRVTRGGSWNRNARYCRVSNRGHNSPDYRTYGLGLRLAL